LADTVAGAAGFAVFQKGLDDSGGGKGMRLNRREQRKQRIVKISSSLPSRTSVQIFAGMVLLSILIIGTVRDPFFWFTADQRGDFLMNRKEYAGAAKAYEDPWRAGTAYYRNGDFEAAAKVFARVPGAVGAFDQGNAWLMHGAYEQAVASYDKALGFQPGWKEAEENKALALARRAAIADAGKDRDEEAAEAYKPDKVVFDAKGQNRKSEANEQGESNLDDDALRAQWLKRVQTTPGDFLRAKFAFQAADIEQKSAKETKGKTK
jgi:Ca-activated chloride channel family protein